MERVSGGGVPLSATQATPPSPPPQMYPKASLSGSSGYYSFPIRAPPTVDSDFEFSLPTNGQDIGVSTSGGSDIEFESEGFETGEDEFETASERPFVADPGDETAEESDIDPRGEIGEESGLVEEFVASRPFVKDVDEETLATPVEEEVENGGFGEPADVGVGNQAIQKLGMPIAMLSAESDEDSAGTVEVEVEDDGFSGAVGVPGIHILGKADSAIRVKVFGVEEEEEEKEDGSQFEPALEAEVVEDSDKVVIDELGSPEGCIAVKDSVNDFVSAELIEDRTRSPDDAESLVGDKDDFLGLNSEIHGLENMEQQASELKEGSMKEQNRVEFGDNTAISMDATTQMDVVIDCKDGDKALRGGEIMASRIDNVDAIATQEVEQGFSSVTLEANVKEIEVDFAEVGRSVKEQNRVEFGDNTALSTDSTTQVDMVIDCKEGEKALGGGEIIASRIDTADPIATQEVEQGFLSATLEVNVKEIEVDFPEAERSMKEQNRVEFGDNTALSMDATTQMDMVIDCKEGEKALGGGEIVASRINKVEDIATQEVEQGFCSVPLEANVKEIEVDFAEVGRSENFWAEITMNCQNSEIKGVDVSESVIHGRVSDGENLEGTAEQRMGSGVKLHDFVPCSSIDHVDTAVVGYGTQNLDSTTFSERFAAQESKHYGNCHSPRPTEGIVIEEGLHGEYDTLYPPYLGSNLHPEVKVEGELREDEADHDPDNSEDDSKGLSFGVSDTTKLIMDDLEQSLIPTSLGESSQDLLQRAERTIIGDSDEEVETGEESEGNELFYSNVLAALLKEATGAGSGGGRFTSTSVNGSRVFSLEHPGESSTSVNYLRPAVQVNHRSLFNASELMDRARDQSEQRPSEEDKEKLKKIELLRVNFLRLVKRLGLSPEDSTAAQVLYRLAIAVGKPSSQPFSIESATMTAMELEAEGKNDFSLNILVLGKTGVGKSATINSIFGEKMAVIDAFEPATTAVKDIVGTIDGIKVRIFDTPGLRSSIMEQTFNRKVLLSIRKLTKKCPPDIVLYVDRLDTHTRDLNDLPLLRSITGSLGSSIWHNAIVTLTHAGFSPPDGPSGSPLSYDLFVAQRSRAIQQLISQAVGDLRMMSPSLMSPVSLVENHPSYQKGKDGQTVLPIGESWRPQLLLLCCSIKILSEAKSLAKTQDLFDHRKLFGFRARSPPLPYLLSSLLQSNAHPKLSAEQGGDNLDSDTELVDFSDSDEEYGDEYDQLPPFKPLKRSQIAKLSKDQRRAYVEEHDYRVRLLQKKQWREEVKRLRELKKRGKDGPSNYYPEENGDEETGSPSAVAVPLPDLVLPASFDGDNPAYRYRFLEPTSSLLLTRPVLDVHGWDHDCGYDGVSLESSLAIAGCFPAVIAVQITKDKKEFNIRLDSSVAAKHGENGSTMAGLDIQTLAKQLAYIFKGETKFKNYRINKTSAGVSVTFLGESVATGLKIEDQIAVAKRAVLVGSAGAIRSQGDVAYGANLEVRLREKDFPIGEDQTTLGLSMMSLRGELIWGGNLQSQFSLGRSSKMVVRAGLNNKLSGQVSVRTSSSEQLQLALLGILPIANAIVKDIFLQFRQKYLAP